MIYTRQVCSMAHALDKLPCQPIILPSTLPMHCRQLIRSAMKGRSIVMCIFHCVQFSAECSPPVLARKAMFMRSGFSGFACEQFHRHAPQWTHCSRSELAVRLRLRGSEQASGFDVEAPGQCADVVHGQAALPPHQFRPE